MIVLKPASSMRTVYGPPGNAESTNSPLASVTPSRDTPVPSWVASTLAPGITAVELSRTRPTSVAVVTCASTWFEENSERAVMQIAMVHGVAHVAMERKRRRGTSRMGPTSLKCKHAPAKDGQRLRRDYFWGGLYSFVFRRFKMQRLGRY